MENNEPKLDAEKIDFISSLNGKALYLPYGDLRFLSLRNVSLAEDSLETSNVVFLAHNDLFWKVNLTPAISLSKIGSASKFLLQIKTLRSHQRLIFSRFSAHVDTLEDQLLEGSSTRYFNSTWFSLKKEISAMERTFSRNIFALNDFLLDYQLSKGDAKQAQTILVHLNSDLRSCQSDLQKLESAHQYVTVLKSEKLNKNLYLLSLVSGVFLPLNLIVGFFGMNSDNLFFAGNPNGTWYVLYILGGVFAFLIMGLPVLQFIDQLILKRLIGRNDIYRKIQGKIGSLMIESDETK